MSAPDSIELLTRAGIDFNQNLNHGIDFQYFGEVLMTSGIVLNEEVRWMCVGQFLYLIDGVFF